MFFAQDNHTIRSSSCTDVYKKKLLKSAADFRKHVAFPFRNRYKG